MSGDKLVILFAVPFRGIASVEKAIGRNTKFGALPKQLGVGSPALQINGVRACRGNPLLQRLRRTADIERTELEVRIAHKRITRRVHPAVRFVIRVEECAARRRLDDETNVRLLDNISIVLQRKIVRSLIEHVAVKLEVLHFETCVLASRVDSDWSLDHVVAKHHVVRKTL